MVAAAVVARLASAVAAAVVARLASAVAAAVVGWLVTAAALSAASPTPQAGGDPRSSGQGPGLVGDPALAITIVLLTGVVALLVTLAWVRVTGGPRS